MLDNSKKPEETNLMNCPQLLKLFTSFVNDFANIPLTLSCNSLKNFSLIRYVTLITLWKTLKGLTENARSIWQRSYQRECWRLLEICQFSLTNDWWMYFLQAQGLEVLIPFLSQSRMLQTAVNYLCIISSKVLPLQLLHLLLKPPLFLGWQSGMAELNSQMSKILFYRSANFSWPITQFLLTFICCKSAKILLAFGCAGVKFNGFTRL